MFSIRAASTRSSVLTQRRLAAVCLLIVLGLGIASPAPAQITIRENVVLSPPDLVLDVYRHADSTMTTSVRGASGDAPRAAPEGWGDKGSEGSPLGRSSQEPTCDGPYGPFVTGGPPQDPIALRQARRTSGGIYDTFPPYLTHPGPYYLQFQWDGGYFYNAARQRIRVALAADSEVGGEFVNVCDEVVPVLDDSALNFLYYPPFNETLPRFIPDPSTSFAGETLYARFNVELDHFWVEDRDDDGEFESYDTTLVATATIPIRPPRFEVYMTAVGARQAARVKEADALNTLIPDETTFRFKLDPGASHAVRFNHNGTVGSSVVASFESSKAKEVALELRDSFDPALLDSTGCATGDIVTTTTESYGLDPVRTPYRVCLQLDLQADSDNDGVYDADWDPLAEDEWGSHAIVSYNDDDDDGNGVDDLSDTSTGGGIDDDLEPVVLALGEDTQLSTASSLTGRLEAISGEDNVLIWEDASKSEQVILPADIPLGELPLTYYAEGVEWNEESTELRFAFMGGGNEVLAADTLLLYSGPASVGLPSEVVAGNTPLVLVVGMPPTGWVDIYIYKNGSEVGYTYGENNDVVHIADLSDPYNYYDVADSPEMAEPGDEYSVEVWTLDAFVYSQSSTVVAGEPASITLSTGSTPFVGDGRTQRTFTATVVDAKGFPVEDGTGVWFEVKNRTGGEADSLAATTLSGQATVSLTAPTHGSVTVRALSAAASSAFNARRASPSDCSAMNVSASSSAVMCCAPRPCSWSSSARCRIRRTSATESGSSTNTRERLSSAPITSNDGFSVVAPISATVPFSTCGRNASCCALLNR